MVVEIFSWPDLGLNQRPPDSQSDTLPTVLGGPAIFKDVHFLTVQVFCFIIMEKKFITLYNFVETQYVKM